VPWAKFHTAFSGHHIPTGLMARKLQEFLHLQQGLNSVYEYSKKFNHLSQYGSYHADTDDKKMSLFHQGLSPVLREHLTLFWGCTLNELVSASIEQEDVCRARLEERKKRPLPRPTGVLRPSTTWLTLYLSRWPRVLQSTHDWLLHIELRSRLG
jgi:hypothetical protein